MKWEIRYLPEAEKDFKKLDQSQRILVRKAIKKVQQNPLPVSEGGYGKPLGGKGGRDLTGFLKIKLRQAGIRIVYTLIRTQTEMLIVVIGMREDSEVYETAARRKIEIKNHFRSGKEESENE